MNASSRNGNLGRFAAMVAALTIAGCGADDDSSTPAESSSASGAGLTEEEFVTQANAICAAANEPIEREVASLNTGKPLTEAQIEGLAAVVVPNVQGSIDQIRELPAPEGDEETVAAFLDAAQAEVDTIEGNPTVLASDDTDPFEETNQLANEYGLTECGG